MKHIILPALIFLLALNTSCRKNVRAGQLISASGYVVDTAKQKRLPGTVVYIFGETSTFYGTYYNSTPLDSALSGADGQFSLVYTAAGNSVDYALGVRRFYEGSAEPGVVPAIGAEFYPFNYKYQLTQVMLKATELDYVKLHLHIISNPYDSLLLSVQTNYFDTRRLFIGSSVDTTFYTRSIPNFQNWYQYEILTSNLRDSGFFRRQIDTIIPGLADTINITKTINSTYDIPLMH